MNYEEALAWLHSSGMFGMKLGLSRVEKLLDILGHPERDFASVHVAGTNGKGSTSTMIFSALREAGYKVGLFTSPHLQSYTERIRVNEELIPEEKVAGFLTRMRPYVEEMENDSDVGRPTEFELGTAMCFWYLAEQGVDYGVIEVGLGGRYDATNVIVPMVSVITHISYDHMDKLGSTLAEISGEKAGIVKPGVPVVVSPQDPEALEVILRTAETRGSRVYVVGTAQDADVRYRRLGGGIDGERFSVALPAGDGAWQEMELATSMLGAHQTINAATAFAALEVLRRSGVSIPDAAIARGLLKARIPARLEVVARRPTVILDGAHNLDGAQRLAEALPLLTDGRRCVGVAGFSKDKPVEQMLGVLRPHLAGLYATVAKSSRLGGRDPEEIAGVAGALGLAAQPVRDAADAVRLAALEAGREGTVVVFGSLYLAGEVRGIWAKPGEFPEG